MERDEIMALLEKYWNAETSVKEEKLIKEYFDKQPSEQSIEHHEWFSAIKKTGQITVPIGLTQNTGNGSYKKRFISIAAGVLIVSGLCLGGIGYHNTMEARKAMLILNQAEADLIFMSQSLQQGYNDLNETQETILKVQSSKQQQ